MSLVVEQRLGRLQQLILALLWGEDMYGLEIQRGVTIYGYEVTSGQLYPALKRLEENNCVSSFERAGIGANKKYYRITETGKQYLIGNVLDQIKIIEILASKKLSGIIIESGLLEVEEGDTVVEFSDLRFRDITLALSRRLGSHGRYIIVAEDEREAERLEKWVKIEGIDDRARVVRTGDKSVEIEPDSVDLALILFRMHLDDSAWILSEAKRIIGVEGRIAVFDLLDSGNDFRSDLYGSVLPRHSRMGVIKDELHAAIAENGLKIMEEKIQRGLVFMFLGKAA
jgi:PadR family transcriptional regulator PadR